MQSKLPEIMMLIDDRQSSDYLSSFLFVLCISSVLRE